MIDEKNAVVDEISKVEISLFIAIAVGNERRPCIDLTVVPNERCAPRKVNIKGFHIVYQHRLVPRLATRLFVAQCWG